MNFLACRDPIIITTQVWPSIFVAKNHAELIYHSLLEGLKQNGEIDGAFLPHFIRPVPKQGFFVFLTLHFLNTRRPFQAKSKAEFEAEFSAKLEADCEAEFWVEF